MCLALISIRDIYYHQTYISSELLFSKLSTCHHYMTAFPHLMAYLLSSYITLHHACPPIAYNIINHSLHAYSIVSIILLFHRSIDLRARSTDIIHCLQKRSTVKPSIDSSIICLCIALLYILDLGRLYVYVTSTGY